MICPIGGIVKAAKFASSSSRSELIVMVGTILATVLSCICVVVICAAANEASGTAAKITYATPAASTPGGLSAPTEVAGALR